MQKITSNPKKITPRIVVFGRTGSGKSTLGNAICGKKVFKVGTTMYSETRDVQQHTMPWTFADGETTEVTFIDTPGFADNRGDSTNEDVLMKIVDLLQSLQGGFNIALFCWAAAARFDNNDINELNLLGLILGSSVFTHTWIVVTQFDTFELKTQEQRRKNIPLELPSLLAANRIPYTNSIYFSHISNSTLFNQDILGPLGELIKECPKINPEPVIAFSSENSNNVSVRGRLAKLTNTRFVADKFIEILTCQLNEAQQEEAPQEEIDTLKKKLQDMEKLKQESEAQRLRAEEELKARRERESRTWNWNQEDTACKVNQLEANVAAIRNDGRKTDEVRLSTLISAGIWKWKIEITHRKIWIKKVFSIGDTPLLGFRDDEGNSYDITFRGLAKRNLLNTPKYSSNSPGSSSKVVELHFIIDFSKNLAQVLYQGIVIAENPTLRPGIKIRPYVSICPEDSALIVLFND